VGALVIFTTDVPRLARFYVSVLAAEQTLEASGDIRVRNEHDEVLVHAARAGSVSGDSARGISSPRVNAALKPVFEVASLTDALAQVEPAGGCVTDYTFRIEGSTRHDVVDPDGNVLQLRD
jgi:predicted enzyme related to lactoylglutathione lyase